MKELEYNGEQFRTVAEFRRVRMTPRTMELATDIQEMFRRKGGLPTSLEFVVECAISLLHEDLSSEADRPYQPKSIRSSSNSPIASK